MIYWLLIPLLLLTACEKKATTETAPRPVKAMQVKESSATDQQVIFPGTLRALKRADLSLRVDGTVILRDITVGYRAKKDELLIQLDPRDYEVALKKAKGAVESIQAQLDFADRDYARMKYIYEKDPGAISQSMLDRKKETSNRLKADLIVAQSDVDKATDDLSYTSLKAPFDGVVAAIYVENHEQVRAKQPILRFLDTSEGEMEINVPEKYIHTLLATGATPSFEVRLDAFPNQTFAASIKEMGTEASSTTQTYPITLTLQNVPLELSLLAGMSGRAILKQPKTYLTPLFPLPKSAVFADASGTYVWVINPQTQVVHKTAVTLDQESREDKALVNKGLSTGDWVVTAGTSFLSEGQKVKFVAEPPGS